jgi:sporulation protein YabP
MEQTVNFANHGVILENRKSLSLSGVEECLGFDDETIRLKTKLGELYIKGIGLHIVNFDTKSGDLTADGKINAIIYTASDNNKNNFFGKIFR